MVILDGSGQMPFVLEHAVHGIQPGGYRALIDHSVMGNPFCRLLPFLCPGLIPQESLRGQGLPALCRISVPAVYIRSECLMKERVNGVNGNGVHPPRAIYTPSGELSALPATQGKL